MKLPWIWKGCWFVSQWVPKISLFNGCLLEVTISLSCSPKGLPHGLWKIIDLKVDKAILEFQRAILWKAAQWKFQWLSPSSYFAWFDKPSCLLVQHVQPAVLLAKALYRQALFLPDSASDISASRPFTMETDPFPIGSMYGNHGIYANMTGVYWWVPCCHIYHTWIPWDTNQISLVSQCSDWAILGRGVSCEDKIHAIHVAWLTSHDQSYIAGNPRARNETQQEQLNVHGWTVWRHHRWPVKQLRHVAPFGCQSE
jgi:hypothetical protein